MTETIMQRLTDELEGTLKALSESSNLTERNVISKTIKNLSSAYASIVDATDTMMMNMDDMDSDFDPDDNPFQN
jgi:hypothetical protein